MSVNNNKKSCNKTDGQRLKKETVKIKVKNANGEKNEIKSKKWKSKSMEACHMQQGLSVNDILKKCNMANVLSQGGGKPD